MLCCAVLKSEERVPLPGESLQIQLVTVGRGRASGEQLEFWVPEMAPFGGGLSVRQVGRGYMFRKLEAR